MPDNPAVLPIEGAKGNEMSTVEIPGDVDQDCVEVLHESTMQTHEALLTETSANDETAGNIVRLSGARKFNREDPIEAAAAEVIMRKKI